MLISALVLYCSGILDPFSRQGFEYPTFGGRNWQICSHPQDLVEEYHVWEGAT